MRVFPVEPRRIERHIVAAGGVELFDRMNQNLRSQPDLAREFGDIRRLLEGRRVMRIAVMANTGLIVDLPSGSAGLGENGSAGLGVSV